MMLLRIIMLGLVNATALRIPVEPRTPPATDNKMSLWSGCCLLGCDSSLATVEGHNCRDSNNQSLAKLYDMMNGPNAPRIAQWGIQDWLDFIGAYEQGAKYVFQVGSYGAHLDEVYPLLKKLSQNHTQEWHGVIAEASPHNIDKLKVAYADELSKGKLHLIHAAVTDVCQNATLRFIAPNPKFWGDKPDFKWKLGTGSIKDSEVGQAMQTWGKDQWENLEVPCGTTDTVMHRGHAPDSPDFVQVDAESHDARILMGINFNKFSPKLIRWESLPVLQKSDDNALLLDKLYINGYLTIGQAGDPFAVRPDVLFAAAGFHD